MRYAKQSLKATVMTSDSQNAHIFKSEEIITKQAAVIVLTMAGMSLGGTRVTRRKPDKKGDLPKQFNAVKLGKKL